MKSEALDLRSLATEGTQEFATARQAKVTQKGCFPIQVQRYNMLRKRCPTLADIKKKKFLILAL